MRKLLVTSALPYANGPIHLGHLVEYIQTDIWVRFCKLRGRDTVYLCADDTHGTPIMMRAKDEGISPEDLIGRVWQEHRRDFSGFQIQFDNYYTTHSEENRILSAGIYEELRHRGHISERTIAQAYCDTDKMFLPDRYIRGKCPNCGADDQYGDVCEICSTTYTPRDLVDPNCAQCGSQPVWRESTHIFFRLGDFTNELRKWVSDHVAAEVGNKLAEWFKAGLQEWDISRDAPYFGFEIPDRPGKYFYVWLDAPVGYMASTMDYCQRAARSFDGYWKSNDTDVVHFIGKDIIYFHALFWPAMLMGAGYRTPTRLVVHGFLTVNGEKMSKSRGTFINAETYLKYLDPQYLRYYYSAKLSSALIDIDLNFDDFVNRVNADLVHKITNIPSRVLAILHQDCGGRMGCIDEPGGDLIRQMRLECESVAQLYEHLEYGQVTRRLTDMAGVINGYLQTHRPWAIAKADPVRAATICTVALNAFKILATLMCPILPEFGRTMARLMGLAELTWEGLDDLLEDRPVLPYERLVERLDRSRLDRMVADSSASSTGLQLAVPPELTLDPLVDLDLHVMRVEAAEVVAGSNQLLSLTLQFKKDRRLVLAGLGTKGPPTAWIDKNLLVITNLAPKTIHGLISQGMVLAAELGDGSEPLAFEDVEVNASIE